MGRHRKESTVRSRKKKEMIQVAKICEECGKVFWMDSHSSAKYCSKKCVCKMMRKCTESEKQCIICGKSFIANDRRTKMCSAECIRKRQYQLQSEYKSRLKKVKIIENTLAIAEKNEKARALGLSYGQYDMMLYLNSLETEKMGRSMHE